MEEIEGFRYRCRVSVCPQSECCQMRIDSLAPVLLSWQGCEAERVLCLCPGRHALGDQAGSEGSQAEGDQAGAAKLRKTQSKWRLLVCRDLPGDATLSWLNVAAVTQTYFEDNPRDLQLLRHDKDLHPAVVKPHLRNLPDYLSETGSQMHHSYTKSERSPSNNSDIHLLQFQTRWGVW